MRTRFDLVLAFIGSAACSPVLEELMLQNWDPRFFFPKWNTELVDRLLEQQEGLKRRGVERHVMILMDDVVLDSKAADQIANCGMRGRHFNVSIMACAVSYTTLPKKFRRSLDALLVFSCPMTGDIADPDLGVQPAREHGAVRPREPRGAPVPRPRDAAARGPAPVQLARGPHHPGVASF
jgi:hypothetical protein